MALTILALRALGLGDLLTVIPALRGLRRQYPGAEIILAGPEALRFLVESAGCIDTIVPVHGLDASPPKVGHIDVAVNLHGRGPQSISWLSRLRPSRILSHAHLEHVGVDGPRWRPDLHETERWTRLVNWGGADAERNDLLLDRPVRRSPYAGAVVVHVGAGAAARRWPAGRFAEVIRILGAQTPVVITGNCAEREIADEAARRAGLGAEHVLAGELDIPELAALVAQARVVLCGDTGVAHLATAFATPSVLLFGPTDPARWGPPVSPRHRVLWAGRTGDPHATRPSAGLLQIRPQQVSRAVADLLRAGSPGESDNVPRC